MSEVALNSNQFPEVYASLGISTYDLGCIMLDVDPIKFSKVFGVDEAATRLEEVYWHPDHVTHPYTGGVPITDTAHATLLYGLMKPGPEWKEQVDAVLTGWEPEPLEVDEVSFFPSNIPGEDYNVIIAKLKVTPNLDEGHKRLQLLPHIDTFPDYHPHITIAYTKGGDKIRDGWIEAWGDYFNGATLDVNGLNYGGN